jgi:hypothetical protein
VPNFELFLPKKKTATAWRICSKSKRQTVFAKSFRLAKLHLGRYYLTSCCTESLRRRATTTPYPGKYPSSPFRKVFKTGLSVWRAMGPDEDVSALMEEALSRRAGDDVKSIYGVLEASVLDIKKITDSEGAVCFCLYDQTVTRMRPELPPVPTHAGIFQRLPPPSTVNRATLQKDIAGKLRELFEKTLMSAHTYRNGICVGLNRRSMDGEFTR